MESPPGQVCGVPPSYWGRRFLLRISYLGGSVQAGPPTHEWLSAALVFLGFEAVCKILRPKATVQVTFLLGAFECVAGPGTRDVFRCGGSEYGNVSPSW